MSGAHFGRKARVSCPEVVHVLLARCGGGAFRIASSSVVGSERAKRTGGVATMAADRLRLALSLSRVTSSLTASTSSFGRIGASGWPGPLLRGAGSARPFATEGKPTKRPPKDDKSLAPGTILEEDWALQYARKISQSDPLNPFVQRPEIRGMDPRLEWRARLPGDVAQDTTAEEALEGDRKALQAILAIPNDSQRRKRLRRFLMDRQFIQPIPLESESGTKRRSKVYIVGWNRSAHMTPGGVANRLGVMVITGDGLNTVGLGYGAGTEAPKALDRAYRRAQRNTVKVPKFMLHTIREPVEAQVGACIVKMWPSLDQRGYRCNQYTKYMAELAGIKDIRSRVLRRRHTFNQTKAAFQCFRVLAQRFAGEIEDLLGQGDVDRAQALLSQAFHPETPQSERAMDVEEGPTAAEAAARFDFTWVPTDVQADIIRGRQRVRLGSRGSADVDWDGLYRKAEELKRQQAIEVMQRPERPRRDAGTFSRGLGARARGSQYTTSPGRA